MPLQQAQAEISFWLNRDLVRVAKIEKESFPQPWTSQDFSRWKDSTDHTAIVARVAEEVVGFVLYELVRTRFHIRSLAVCPLWRKRGIGQCLMAGLVKKLNRRRNRITTVLHERDIDAQKWFKKQNFKWVKTFGQYFEETGDDAYCFEYQLS